MHWNLNLRELYLGTLITSDYFFPGNNNLSSLGINALIEMLPLFKNLKTLG